MMDANSTQNAGKPEHLTDILRESGRIVDGHVRSVAVEASYSTQLSHITRLRLEYDGASSDAPRSLILKTVLPDRAGDLWNAGRQEVAFYREVASVMPGTLAPYCFEAFWDDDSKTWHLILEDLKESHVIASAWPLPPNRKQCENIVDARGRFHARWWDNPCLGASVGTWLDADALNENLQKFTTHFSAFVDELGDRFPPCRRKLYERLISESPRLAGRYHSHRAITVVQGDAHVWNCFLPRNSASRDVRFFDWDSWRIDVGSDDLANMMALHWYPDLRRRLENSLLDHYHAALVEHGVSGYDRRALEDDYRLSVLWQITAPVWQWANKIPPVIWWNNLERVMSAADDLDCRELLA